MGQSIVLRTLASMQPAHRALLHPLWLSALALLIVNDHLLKGSGLSDLVQAIRAVAAGEAFLSPAVAKILLRDAQAEEEPSTNGPLTAREREVLQLVGEGSSSPEIARSLHLSVKTVEGHRSRIMAKLNLHDVAGLVRYAIRTGLVSPDK